MAGKGSRRRKMCKSLIRYKPVNASSVVQPPPVEQPVVQPQSVEPPPVEQPVEEPPSVEEPVEEPPSVEQPKPQPIDLSVPSTVPLPNPNPDHTVECNVSLVNIRLISFRCLVVSSFPPPLFFRVHAAYDRHRRVYGGGFIRS